VSQLSQASRRRRGQRIPLFLTENCARTERKLSDAERQAVSPADRRYYNAVGWKKEWIFTATVKLQIAFGTYVYGSGLRTKWSDRPGTLLESQIGKLLGEVAAVAAHVHEQEIDRARILAEFRKSELDRQERGRLEKLQDAREQFLSEKAQIYEEARQFGAYISQLQRDTSDASRVKVAAFLAWASDHIRALQAECSIEAIAKDLESSELFA